MNIDIQQLRKGATALKRSLSKISSKQVKSEKIKEDVRTFVLSYFKEYRPSYLSKGLDETSLDAPDTAMHNVLRCAQKDSLKSGYISCLKSIFQSLHELEIITVTPLKARASGQIDVKQKRTLETLAKICLSAAASYEQALLDLHDNSRKSWRGTAVEFRESLRELLDVMAPDTEVIAQKGFRLEGDAKKPTMKQKTVFILKSRKLSGSQREAPTEAVEVVDAQIGKYVRSVYSRTSVGTHTMITKSEALKIRDYVTLALAELLEIKHD